jgi:hypothetical protein
MTESRIPLADSDAAPERRPSPGDVDIYRALVSPRTQVDRPFGLPPMNGLRRWKHWLWFQGMLTRIVRRAREGADRLAK